MKIVYLHQYFNTPEMPGSTRSYEMARRWVARGHIVHVVTSSRTAHQQTAWMITSSAGAVIHWRAVTYSNAMGFADRMIAFLKFVCASSPRSRRLKPDVIYVSSTPLTVILPALFAAALRRTPIVLEVRDLWPTMPIATGDLRSPFLKMMALALEKVAYSSASRIVALSPDMAKGIVKRGVSPEKIVTAPNSCDFDMFEVDESRGIHFRQQSAWLDDRPFVVYCGTMGKLNDLSYLVRLAASMKRIDPSVVFGLYGSGAEEAKIRALAEANGTLNVNLFLNREMAKNEMPDVLSAATVVTSVFMPLPEMRANSANKFFDGLAASRPLAINYEGWQAELLRNSGAGIVMHESNAEKAAEQLASLIHDPMRLCKARSAAHKLAHNNFSRDALSNLVLSTIESAASHSAAPRLP